MSKARSLKSSIQKRFLSRNSHAAECSKTCNQATRRDASRLLRCQPRLKASAPLKRSGGLFYGRRASAPRSGVIVPFSQPRLVRLRYRRRGNERCSQSSNAPTEFGWPLDCQSLCRLAYDIGACARAAGNQFLRLSRRAAELPSAQDCGGDRYWKTADRSRC